MYLMAKLFTQAYIEVHQNKRIVCKLPQNSLTIPWLEGITNTWKKTLRICPPKKAYLRHCDSDVFRGVQILTVLILICSFSFQSNH